LARRARQINSLLVVESGHHREPLEPGPISRYGDGEAESKVQFAQPGAQLVLLQGNP
jgi:hypothetical protein